MLRIAVLAVALMLTAAPVVAQAPATYTLGEYVETRRPAVAKRKLSGAEKSEADRLVSEIRAAVKKSQRIPPATLERLAPLAASGDRNLMKAMVEGYEAATPVTPEGVIVLVVEDDDRVRELTVASLRDLGYVVVHAGRPADALEKIREMPKIDLLFTDVVMPEMNGRQLADQAAKLRPDMPVLFTTGYTQNAIVHNGILDPGTTC
jgi:CheY-like chemotaxis protein